MPRIIRYLQGHKIYFMIIPVFMILMITLIIFSQIYMEIYAYNFIAKTNLKKNTIEKIYKYKKITDEKTTEEQKEMTVVSPVISFVKPIKGGITTSLYGDKANRTTTHKGHDWAVDTGTKVMASAEGIVEKAYFSDSYGYNVLINHENGIKTRYAHLSQLNVIEGQHVKQKQTIGLSGTTGDSTGPHLHFEVIENGKFCNPLNYIQ